MPTEAQLARGDRRTGRTRAPGRSVGAAEAGRIAVRVSGQVATGAGQAREHRVNVDNPAVLFAGAFLAMLKDAGVAVTGGLLDTTLEDWTFRRHDPPSGRIGIRMPPRAAAAIASG